jgi:hypothetical protein
MTAKTTFLTLVSFFDATSKILKKAKLMVDLSFLPNDVGGTQYTFLDALYHNCAIILNRQWMENVDPKYRDFKEGENCYAVSNAEELKELLDDAEKIDTSKTVQNARKLLDRHIANAAEKSYLCGVGFNYIRLFIVIVTIDSECRGPTGIRILCCKQK